MKKNKISKNWIIKQKRDVYVRRSKIEGFRSRAVYKLMEIDEKFKVLKNGQYILDLGGAPGSWSQYLSKRLKNVKLLSIDLLEIEKIKNVKIIKGDFTSDEYKKKIKNFFNSKIDTIISDMAVNTSGNKNLDAIVTGELVLEAMEFSRGMLKTNGQFVSKIFMGSSLNEILSISKKYFKETHIYKPPSSRNDSKETFLISKFLR
ncbi:MAG: RlmE family RNA methyltransferase [Rickettsiales bacterium TMED289]|nr:MAG: RlmE family RNA methyltransferase [Rickettsiales bacterium TMED289]